MTTKINREEYETAQKVLRTLADEDRMRPDFTDTLDNAESILGYIKPDYVDDSGIMDEIESEFARL